MSYKVYIDAGHGGSDPGAVKYVTEKAVNLQMALACRDYLKARGVLVKMSRTTDKDTSLNAICRECNEWGADLAVSCHNNAGGGDGFEVIHHYGGGKGKNLAKNIEAEVIKLGQNSRGLKTRRDTDGSDYFGFIRMINCPSVICEGAFVDNKTDVKIIDTIAEQKKFGEAYARGVLKTLGIADKNPATKPAAKEFLVRVKVDKLNIRLGPGTNYGISGVIKDKGTYTIVEERNGFGKLKSGKGWISINPKYVTRV